MQWPCHPVRSNPILSVVIVCRTPPEPSPGQWCLSVLDRANVSKCLLTPLARPTLVHLNFVFGYKMESET